MVNLYSDKTFDLIKSEVVKYYNDRRSKGLSGYDITKDDVVVVWYGFILGSFKAWVTTSIQDGMYYEVTYNLQKNEMYIDAYKRWENVCIEFGIEVDS